jgi:hypothetical protein
MVAAGKPLGAALSFNTLRLLATRLHQTGIFDSQAEYWCSLEAWQSHPAMEIRSTIRLLSRMAAMKVTHLIAGPLAIWHQSEI